MVEGVAGVTTGHPRGSCGESWRTWDNVGRGEVENIHGLRARVSLGVSHHGGLEHRSARSWGFIKHRMRRELQVYGRVGEEGGKGA